MAKLKLTVGRHSLQVLLHNQAWSWSEPVGVPALIVADVPSKLCRAEQKDLKLHRNTLRRVTIDLLSSTLGKRPLPDCQHKACSEGVWIRGAASIQESVLARANDSL